MKYATGVSLVIRLSTAWPDWFLSHSDEGKCLREAERRAGAIKQEIAAKGYAGIKIIGPAPAFVSKLRGRYQVQVILLGPELHRLLQDINLPAGWVLDVDPVGMI